jgi:hypothetical protein
MRKTTEPAGPRNENIAKNMSWSRYGEIMFGTGIRNRVLVMDPGTGTGF